MKIAVYETRERCGESAAKFIGGLLKEAIARKGEAGIVLATGRSQFEMLSSLVAMDVDWGRVTAFHMDEYMGLPASHPASFRRYLKERFHDKAAGLKSMNYINGEAADPAAECRRLGDLIRRQQIDVVCAGIGENGHLAFNDPPADFDTEEPYITVSLDGVCRRQQLGEGWFKTLDEVPRRAISMSIRQIMKGAAIACIVTGGHKAALVRQSLEGPLSNMMPASILQTHKACSVFLDKPAAGLLRPDTISARR